MRQNKAIISLIEFQR